MSHPHQVEVTNFEAAERIRGHVRLGHYFVYVDDPQAVTPAQGRAGRLSRLLVKKPEGQAGRRVLPLLEQPVALAGVTIHPPPLGIDPMGCVVTDRDLYRAEEDTVHLFIAMPAPPEGLRLVVECNGQPFTSLEPELESGVGIETLSALLPGRYTAQLAHGEQLLGTPVSFTVAEYTLAPLSGRLARHELDRGTDRLSFELAVESYQLPFDGKLKVALVDRDREVARTTLKPDSPGCFRGELELQGEGPFRLRLEDAEDAERLAEVVIPGSRARERQASVVSELGQEVLLSMMPEPGALPQRGGYLTQGDFLATPLVVEEVVSERWTLQVKADLEALQLVLIDLTTGRLSVRSPGNVAAGREVVVEPTGPMCMVFAGCYVDGTPFEGYTTFLRPVRLGLTVEAPEAARPGQDLVVKLGCTGSGTDAPVPVLLCVRDQRLTATDTPEVGLGASAKRAIDTAIEGMAESSIAELEVPYPVPPTSAFGGFVEQAMVYEDSSTPETLSMAQYSVKRSAARDDELFEEADYEPLASESLLLSEQAAAPVLDAPASALRRPEDLRFRLGAVSGEKAAAGPYRTAGREVSPEELVEPARAEFPEVLFYAIVPVTGAEQVTVPLGDALATLTVEAFALARGDWAQARTQVVVDQPVRVDLELPPAVHPEDKVVGRLRVSTPSGRARVSLTRDGKPVPLRNARGCQPAKENEEIATPAMLELAVHPGTHVATVTDPDSGEQDRAEVVVAEPGRFRSMARELGLLQQGDAITLDSAGALTLRVLPAVTESFTTLLDATADYSHLCCEQTAAKILASVVIYLAADRPAQRQKAEQVIVAGIAREKRMFRRGKGFVMYPDGDYFSQHYSELAVRYLWRLRQLDQVPGLSRNLRDVARQGLELADDAARAHGISPAPRKINTPAEAYDAATAKGGDREAAHLFVERLIDFGGKQPRCRESRGAVGDRSTMAYAAAVLIAVGQLERGVALANLVTRQFNETGGLYSTVDSVAAIAVMIQLRASGLVSGEARLQVNGSEISALEAAGLADQVESIEVLQGVAAVEVTRIVEESWDRYQAGFTLRVGFRDARDRKVKRFKMGDRAELVVSLPDGYQLGDLVHVALPACMAWIKGGGKVKRFTLDFEGRQELRIPLVVTSKIEGKQRFAVCVRNMFEEERASSPGLLAVDAGSRFWG